MTDKKELHCQECGQYLPTALTRHTYEDCEKYKEQFQPRLAALQQRVKELEDNRLNSETVRIVFMKYPDLAAFVMDYPDSPVYEELAQTKALESQLKGMVELDENQDLPKPDQRRGYPVHIDWHDGQQAMWDAGFRKVKLGKGETK